MLIYSEQLDLVERYHIALIEYLSTADLSNILKANTRQEHSDYNAYLSFYAFYLLISGRLTATRDQKSLD